MNANPAPHGPTPHSRPRGSGRRLCSPARCRSRAPQMRGCSQSPPARRPHFCRSASARTAALTHSGGTPLNNATVNTVSLQNPLTPNVVGTRHRAGDDERQHAGGELLRRLSRLQSAGAGLRRRLGAHADGNGQRRAVGHLAGIAADGSGRRHTVLADQLDQHGQRQRRRRTFRPAPSTAARSCCARSPPARGSKTAYTFSYANAALVPGGTYKGTVSYTLVLP